MSSTASRRSGGPVLPVPLDAASGLVSSVRRRSSGGIQKQKTCLCSPTMHPGSFRCSLHKMNRLGSPSRLKMKRSTVKIDSVVDGNLMKRALAALIRPSSHRQRRRAVFKPRPSRLSIMRISDQTN